MSAPITALEIDRRILESMRIESALLPSVERRAMHLAEAHQRRIDKVAGLHTPDDRFDDCRECGHHFPCPTVIALGITD